MSSETPLSTVNVTSLFYDDFYFGKSEEIYIASTWSMPGRGKSGLGRKGGEKAMAGPGLLVSMVGTQGDIESRPPHHGEPSGIHTLTPLSTAGVTPHAPKAR